MAKVEWPHGLDLLVVACFGELMRQVRALNRGRVRVSACEGVDEEDIEHAQLIPPSSQEEVEAAAAEWGAQWRSDVQPKPLPWPDLSLQSPLPALTAQVARKAAHTFPNGTGLGWDKLLPKAVCRCHDKALEALVRLLILIETVGSWPQVVGATLIC